MRGRGPVVHLDRREKARMIESVLEDFRGGLVEGLRILDVGCGNGQIGGHFSCANRVSGVDIEDNRSHPDSSIDFRLTASERLPFDDGGFEVVLSHHVIEHVDDQGLHLEEIRRVLAPDGIAYLATPNRSSPIMEGHVGNDRVLRYRDMARLFRAHGFESHEYMMRVLRDPARFHAEVKWARRIPRVVLAGLRSFFPSQIFILVPTEDPPAQ